MPNREAISSLLSLIDEFTDLVRACAPNERHHCEISEDQWKQLKAFDEKFGDLEIIELSRSILDNSGEQDNNKRLPFSKLQYRLEPSRPILVAGSIPGKLWESIPERRWLQEVEHWLAKMHRYKREVQARAQEMTGADPENTAQEVPLLLQRIWTCVLEAFLDAGKSDKADKQNERTEQFECAKRKLLNHVIFLNENTSVIQGELLDLQSSLDNFVNKPGERRNIGYERESFRRLHAECDRLIKLYNLRVSDAAKGKSETSSADAITTNNGQADRAKSKNPTQPDELDPFEPHRVLERLAKALNAVAFARTLEDYIDAKNRLLGESGDADYRRLFELRTPFIKACRDFGIDLNEVRTKYKAVIDAALTLRTSLRGQLLPVWPFYIENREDEREKLMQIAKDRLAGRPLLPIGWYDTLHEVNFPIVQAATSLYISVVNDLDDLASFIVQPTACLERPNDAANAGSAKSNEANPTDGKAPETTSKDYQEDKANGKQSRKRGRGRQKGSKTEDRDRKLFLDWKAANHATRITKSDFLRERGLPDTDLAAIERGRKRVTNESKPGNK